jgi:hypothetical protein
MNLEEMNVSEEKTGVSAEADEFSEEIDGAFVAGPSAKPNRGMLGALGLVLACGAGLYFMHLRQGPQSATAASPDTAAASNTIKDFLSKDAANAKLMTQTLRETDKVVQNFRGYPGKTQVPVEDLKTNPFRLSDAVPVKVPDDPDPGLALRRREEERETARKAVQSLQLQSVMRGGNSRACMINNTLYREGDDADGFLVEQIGPNMVVVRKGIFRFELRMTK